jgi:hypothetical protein
MTDKLKTLIMLGVKQTGSYDPDDALTSVEEQLNDREFTLASTFLRWVTIHKKQFGMATFETVFKEFHRTVAI